MTRKKLLVTGAAGTVAGFVVDALRKDYDLVLIDVRDTNGAGEPLSDINLLDLVDTNRDSY